MDSRFRGNDSGQDNRLNSRPGIRHEI